MDMSTYPSLETTLKSLIVPRLAHSGLRGTMKLEIDGEQGGTYYVKLNGVTEITTRPCKVDCILRATRRDFEALVTGRMSLADGVLTERIEVAGDLALVTKLGKLAAELKK